MADQKAMRTWCLGGFSVTWVPKLLLPFVKTRIFVPKKAKFGPKYAFLGTYWPCRFNWSLLVGWWLCRAGCISQDTYLLYIISRWDVSKGLIYFRRGNPLGWFWLTVVESECECQPEFDFIQIWNCWLAYLKDELRRDKTELHAYLKATIRVKFNVSRNFVRIDISKVIINLVPFLENSCSREKQDLMSASKYMLIFNLFIFWFSDLWCERNLIA